MFQFSNYGQLNWSGVPIAVPGVPHFLSHHILIY